ncbi:MAG: alpha,alpha-trehalase, partial [Holophagae bacterium]|nr:alpha,alpha-trehalase [Holophagae bacterium]
NDERGLFFDYDFVNERQSEVASLASMVPLFSGMATQEQAQRVRDNLPLFTRKHGIAVSEDRSGCRDFQWAFPNAWPPFTYVTTEALLRYGFKEDALRIAETYVNTTANLFEKTGQLWEKTDVETGDVAGGEYDAAPMIGWSAGVFLGLLNLLEESA